MSKLFQDRTKLTYLAISLAGNVVYRVFKSKLHPSGGRFSNVAIAAAIVCASEAITDQPWKQERGRQPVVVWALNSIAIILVFVAAFVYDELDEQEESAQLDGDTG